jgi:hypothetical protein
MVGEKVYDYNDGRICENCGTIYYRVITAPRDNFSRRKYCCTKCTFEAQKKHGHWRETYNGNRQVL